ncbi:Wzz/FepE/Etk N-terminal domain-containing protein [Shimia biformata]|uniref:Wzz/FepE/Etk N-terminal domain-containing protein n=1 Tax=Shimia biformata TaxID=1294299 RepID=UPI0023B2D435|nr:Wzz/FepE/Etk N-terminal domain-containing protein [Shimia biformata]
MDRFQSLGEVLGMLRRRVVLWAGVAAIGVLISLFYTLSLPRIYETAAVIQIEQPSIEEATAGTGNLNAATLQKLQIIEQRVMARDNLLDIITKYNLFADDPSMTESMKVYQLRLAARVQQITDPSLAWRPDVSPTALMISVRLGDPEMAANVANELVTNVLDQNARRRAERARETLEFFNSEEKRVREAIVALEDRIAKFKREHAASLPEQVEENRRELNRIRDIVLDLERQIVGQREGITPDINSPMGQRILRLQEQRDLYRERADEIQAALTAAPEVELIYNALHRQLRQLTEQYQAITANRSDAELNQMIEASHQAESFAVLERAVVPEIPVAPRRKRIMGIGVLLSLLAATAAALVVELRNPVIWTAAQFERQLQSPPVVSIPVVELPAERLRRRARRVVGAAVFVSVFVLVVLVILTRGRIGA